jgi:hypothetical protein
MPTVSAVVLGLVALPPTKATGLPKITPSITNCTVPVGVGPKGMGGITVAIQLTGCPAVCGFAEEVTVVVLLPMMVCVRLPLLGA